MINMMRSRMKAIQESVFRSGKDNEPEQLPDVPEVYFQNTKWPTRILSLVHPFQLDVQLDENLELFFGLSIPFLDFKMGVQGCGEAFSFVIDNQDKDRSESFDFIGGPLP